MHYLNQLSIPKLRNLTFRDFAKKILLYNIKDIMNYELLNSDLSIRLLLQSVNSLYILMIS